MEGETAGSQVVAVGSARLRNRSGCCELGTNRLDWLDAYSHHYWLRVGYPSDWQPHWLSAWLAECAVVNGRHERDGRFYMARWPRRRLIRMGRKERRMMPREMGRMYRSMPGMR